MTLAGALSSIGVRSFRYNEWLALCQKSFTDTPWPRVGYLSFSNSRRGEPMKTTKGLGAKLCIVSALAALGGCGGVGTPTSLCGEDEILDTLMHGILNNRVKPAHIRKLVSDLENERRRELIELNAEFDAAGEERSRLIDEGSLSVQDANAAFQEERAEKAEFRRETEGMITEIHKDAEEEDLEDLYNVHIHSVFTTTYEEAPVNHSACKAQVKSDLLEDIMVNYTVHLDTRDGRPYVFD